jgi:Rieske Fe-S protein
MYLGMKVRGPRQKPSSNAGCTLDRRVVLRVLGATAACAGPALLGCGGDGSDGQQVKLPALVNGILALSINDFPMLQDVGGSIIGEADGLGRVAIVRTDAGIICTSATCTHMECPLRYNSLNETLDCSCHGSTFELDGSVITGPATKAVKVYSVTFDGTMIVIQVR